MKNFKLMVRNINVNGFKTELGAFGFSWSDTRAKAIPLHKDTLSIFLRSANPLPGEEIRDCERDRKTEFYILFPKLTTFLEDFSVGLKGSLARVNIVSLKAKGRVFRHYDAGKYYKKRDRYHLVLQSEGSRMKCGDEEVVWREGELWWFNNKLEHEAYNDSVDTERIHVIFDIKPNFSFKMVVRFLLDFLNKLR